MAIWRKPRTEGTEADARNAQGPAAAPAPQRPVKQRADSTFRLPRSIRLEGELIGSTDVEIHGQVEGRIQVEGHRLTVCESGQVMAQVAARTVLVHGQIVGNVTAAERIEIEAGGCVLGDLCAPSIRLADGSRFTGGINREAAPAKVCGRLAGSPFEAEQIRGTDPAADHARRSDIPAGGERRVDRPEGADF
jgi:cytoskeletal protein CcmA (bactofilin family)